MTDSLVPDDFPRPLCPWQPVVVGIALIIIGVVLNKPYLGAVLGGGEFLVSLPFVADPEVFQ